LGQLELFYMHIQDVKQYPAHYLILIGGLILAALAILLSHNLQFQQIIIISIGLFYIGWGIIHHRATDHLTAKIVLEYSLVAAIIMLIINALLLRR